MNSRFHALQRANEHRPVFVEAPDKCTSAYYGEKVFNKTAMRKYLKEDVRRKIYESRENGTYLESSVAEDVAKGMKAWAMSLGATHYTHWFHPLTGGTAEKHDSFATPHGYDGTIEEFTGSVLIQQESDASSFPNGGLRNTFEARGYTAWDSSSPAFIINDTLCIPTIFIAYTGEALDYKTPLLRSIHAISRAATDVMKYFDGETVRTMPQLGWEQEYFLVDKELFNVRPDMVVTGRTLVGRSSVKSQQLSDHYLGSIPERVLAFMQELEFESYKLGIPLKTRHNETAPNQFELAPVYEEMNLAIDHNLVVISLMEKIADKHNFKVLLHEKPFRGINGSGKHCNWSLQTDRGVNVFAPGKTENESLRFMTFLAITLKAVYKNNGLLKASISTATNEHRLGAAEAPPAIISVFIGEQIEQIFDKLISGGKTSSMKSKESYTMGIPIVPDIMIDNTDRNRTSPFAFTGNRFEFRAVGSSANCASAMSVLNTVVAYELIEFKKKVDGKIDSGESKKKAILETVIEEYKECKDICFDGNGYSEEWKKEAKKRKLDCETSVPLILDSYLSKQSKEVFSATKVLSPVELKARNEVFWDTYGKKIDIEAKILCDVSQNHIIPVATRYQSEILDNVLKLNKTFPVKEFKEMSGSQIFVVGEISKHINSIRKLTEELSDACAKAEKTPSKRECAIAYHDKVLPYFVKIRDNVDALELLVDDGMWPMPKYRELLFVN